MKKESYPEWICGPCGRKHGKRTPLMATWHFGTCGVCAKKATPVTEPRDYGHLKDGWAAYQNHADAGRFIVKTGVAPNTEKAYTTTKFTPKGIN